MAQPRIKFTVNDYMTAPPDKRYELLDGELVLAPSPTSRHQRIVGEVFSALRQFVSQNGLGQVFLAPLDVVFSNHDVAQPDVLFISNGRSGIITEANIQGAPDLVVEVLSPATAQYDRGYKRTLYSRSGVQEYWLVDPDAGAVEVLRPSETGLAAYATYHRGDTLTSPLLAGLTMEIEQLFG